MFNQITLICDWFYNVDCKQSDQFKDYSNSRLSGEGLVLLDDQQVIAETGAAAVKAAEAAPVAAPTKAKGKKQKRH